MAPRKKVVTTAKATKVTKPKLSSKPSVPEPTSPVPTALLPSRVHHASYHYPLLLNDKARCDALLTWFEGEEETRSMPWRKAWIDPSEYEGREEELGAILGKRAYEVWVSEVMLQQTRVSTVIPYFNNWISKWPTVQDLADANHDDVLSVWKGLGYYFRATRLHEGAKAMITKSVGSSCPLPSSATALQEFPGIGRYTAGAISSIAFGEAEPVLDGNVARVLSRQLGLYMDAKDKKATDVLWDMADQLIKSVSGTQPSRTPGQWNQAMMELGSTICTPRPRCDECPIQSTCRVYSEGQTVAKKKQMPTVVPDIEDACTLCDVLDTEDLVTASEDVADDERVTKKRKAVTKQTNTISQYFAVGTPKSNVETEGEEERTSPPIEESRKRKLPASSAVPKQVISYCALFPKKVAKKKATEEECVVCMIELRMPNGSSKWLIEQRPDKGLLASLWQFPQNTLSTSQNTPPLRKTAAQKYTSSLAIDDIDLSNAKHVAAFPPLVHVFTHIRLTMHAYQYRITSTDKTGDIDLTCKGPPTRKWVDTESMDNETLSTGMRKCWDLIQKNL
ncbi:DNA glycosylase [Plenodomus tracheiphilus IPT5]|uniref:Adenine DNA glycosylase n=1 Tax=Plenodomus tracheiphilus IPT5 TaxID=1408161 RepID=A0A6A7AWU5_9PLEO|nr:DNA glycosylase [Plenodomus tracheiphilus IPT5]